MAAAGVAVESCVIYFGAELLTTAGLRTAQAATAVSSFYIGILGGRAAGAWLTRHVKAPDVAFSRSRTHAGGGAARRA